MLDVLGRVVTTDPAKSTIPAVSIYDREWTSVAILEARESLNDRSRSEKAYTNLPILDDSYKVVLNGFIKGSLP